MIKLVCIICIAAILTLIICNLLGINVDANSLTSAYDSYEHCADLVSCVNDVISDLP